MKRQIVTGSTSIILDIFIQDSSSTTGAGLTGLAFNTASLTCYYHRNTAAAPVAVTLVTMTVGTFTSSGFKEIDATNMPGWYQLCLPNAAFASSATSVGAHLKGAANMAPLPLEIELTAFDMQVATPSVNATQFAGQTITAAAGVTLPSSVASPTNITAGTITTVTNLTNAPTSGDLTATMKTSVTTAATAATPIAASVTGAVGSVTGNVGGNVVGSVASVTAGVTVTTNNDKTGYGLSAAAVQAIWDALTSALTTVGSVGKLLVDNINATISSRSTYSGGAVASVTGAVGSVTGSVGSVATGGIAAASFAAGAIDAAAIATDAIGSAEISAAAVTKIQSGLSTYAGGDTSGVTTLLSRLSSSRATLLDNLDAAITTRLASASYTAPPSAATIAAAVWDYLTSAATTVSSLGKLIADNLNATVSSRSTYAGADTSGTTTLLSRLTSTRAGNLDNLDAAVSTRGTGDATLANQTSNATSVAAIKAKTDLIPAAPAAVGDIPTATQNADALLNRDMSAVSDTTARSPLNALRLLRNKYSISGTTLTVTKENDTTAAWTAALTTDSAANPITGSDPA
jgi:hypothetical protein